MCGAPENTPYQGQLSNDPDHKTKRAKESATALARLIERQLGYVDGHIDPIALLLFVRAYWVRISAHAHVIHDEA